MGTAAHEFDDFRFDPATGELTRSGEQIALQNQPSRVLAELASRPGELVTRSELHAAVWGATTFVDHDQGLNYCIRQIRRALGDTAEKPRYIETLPRRGYRFLPAVRVISSPPRGVGVTHSPSRRLLLPATLLLTGLLLGAWLDHEAVASGLHDQMTTWIHTRAGVAVADCPWAR
jgi:DNA-binding winged helix-turn-helix (wHTH) protein